jgi:PST family polysaccharide transporter
MSSSDDNERNEHLDTEHLQEDLEERSLRGGLVQSIAQTTKTVVQLVSTLVLARLLTPEDFGLLGMVISVTAFLEMFKDMGLSMATVQKDEITHEQVSSLLWVNVGVSALLMVIAAGLAPVLAWFYQEPRLVEVTLVFAATFLLGGLSIQHEAILRRQMRFRALALINVTAIVCGIGVAIWMAWADFGYWALVAEKVITSAGMAVGVWWMCGWRPSRPAWSDGLGELLAFGGNLTGHSILNYFARNLDDILIGRYYGARAIGLFRKAHEILRLPIKQINSPVSTVAVPLLSRLTDQPERYRRTYLRILEKLLMVTMPLGAAMIAASDWLVFLILGDQWLDVVPIFIALGLGIFTRPLANTTGWLFISQDRTDEMFRWSIVGSILSILSFLAGLPFGVLYVAAFYSVSGVFIRRPILLWWVGRDGPVRMKDFYLTLLPQAIAASGVIAALTWLRYGLGYFEPIRMGAEAAPPDLLTALAGLGAVILLTVGVHAAVLSTFSAGRKSLQDIIKIVQILRRKSDPEERQDAFLNQDG